MAVHLVWHIFIKFSDEIYLTFFGLFENFDNFFSDLEEQSSRYKISQLSRNPDPAI